MVNALGSRSKGPVVQIFAGEFLLLNRDSIACIKIQIRGKSQKSWKRRKSQNR